MTDKANEQAKQNGAVGRQGTEVSTPETVKGRVLMAHSEQTGGR